MGVCHSVPPAFDDASDGEGYRQDGKRRRSEQRIQVQEKRSMDDASKSVLSSKGSSSPGMQPSSPVAASSGPTIQHRTHENTKSTSSRIITSTQSPQGTPIYYRQASNSIQHNIPLQLQQQQQQQQQSYITQPIISTLKQPHSQVGKGMTSGEPDHSDPGAAAQHGQFSYSEASVTQSPGEGYTYSVTHTHQTTDSVTGGSLTAVEGVSGSTGAGSGSSQAQYSNIRLMYATLPFQVDTAHDEYFDADERANLMSTGVLRSGDSAIVENRESLETAVNAGVNEIEMCDIEWKKGQLLGAGSYGQVYLGLNAHTGGLLAVKQVPLNQGVHMEQRVRQLEREIGILRRLSHPAIVAYKGVRVEDGNINIFLEYVPGGSIASLLSRFGKFNETLVRLYTKQILEGLKYLHQHQIVHRDIKGGNILVDINGQCKLADFGASLSLAEMAKEKPTIQGTPYWMAPEVIKQEGHGRKVDIWSVGCTVIEMISGRHPWKRFDTQAAALFHIARATEPPEIPAELSSDGRDFVEWCLKRDPKERPNVLKLLEHPFITGGKDKQINKGRAPLNAAPMFMGMDSEENKSIKRATEDKLPQEAAPPGLDFEGEVGEGQPHPGIADERAIISFLADCHAKMMANVSFEFRSSVRSLGNQLYD